MKKLMALCLSVLMVLSMCTFTVMAEGEVDFSVIANGQPQKFVTSNLVLGEHAITSSNEAVIATDGTVKRPLFEDATVSVAIDGGTAVDVTVKAQTTNVLYSEDFATDDEGTVSGTTRSFSSYSGFSVSTAAGTTTAIADGVVKVDIAADYEKDVKDRRTNFYTYVPSFDKTKPVVVQFDVDNITNIVSSSAEIRPTFYAYPTDGSSKVGLGTIQLAKLYSAGFGASSFCSSDGVPNSKTVKIRYIPTTGEIWLNEQKLSKNLLTLTDGDFSYVALTGINICCAGSNCEAQFDLDNYVVYQEYSINDVLLNATDEQRIEYLKTYLTPEVFANGQSLASVASNLVFSTGLDMEALDATLEWTTSDATVIETDGTIHPKQNTSVNATVQGTLTIGEEITVTKPYNIKLAPAGTIECVTAKFNWDFEDMEVGTTTSTTSVNTYLGGIKGIYFGGGTHEFVNDSERGMMLKSTDPSIIQFSAGQRGPGYNKRYVFGFDYKFTLKANATWHTFTTYMRGNSSQQVGFAYSNQDVTVGDVTTKYPTSGGYKQDTLFASKVPCYNEITAPDVWHHIDVDYNSTKNVYTIYVDDNKINEIPGSAQNSAGYVAYWMHTQLANIGTFYMDNMYVNEYTDSDIVKVDGALRRAVYDAAARETGQSGESGPYRTINRTDLDSVITSGSVPTPQTDSNGAVLTWKVNGVEHTEATYTAPSGAKSATFEVTASYNGKSASHTFTNRFAPVEITGYTFEDRILKTVTIEGNYTGKKLAVVSVSTHNNSVNKVKLVEITDTTVTLPDDSITNNGNEIYFYVFDEETLLPYAFKR